MGEFLIHAFKRERNCRLQEPLRENLRVRSLAGNEKHDVSTGGERKPYKFGHAPGSLVSEVTPCSVTDKAIQQLRALATVSWPDRIQPVAIDHDNNLSLRSGCFHDLS